MSTRFDALDQSSNHNHSPRGIDEEITNTSSFLITCPEDLAGWVIGKEHVCLDALFHDMKRHWEYYFRISRYDLENGGFHVIIYKKMKDKNMFNHLLKIIKTRFEERVAKIVALKKDSLRASVLNAIQYRSKKKSRQYRGRRYQSRYEEKENNDHRHNEHIANEKMIDDDDDDDDDIVHAHDKSTQTKRFADAGTTTLADDLGSSNESYIKEFPPLSSTLSM